MWFYAGLFLVWLIGTIAALEYLERTRKSLRSHALIYVWMAIIWPIIAWMGLIQLGLAAMDSEKE